MFSLFQGPYELSWVVFDTCKGPKPADCGKYSISDKTNMSDVIFTFDFEKECPITTVILFISFNSCILLGNPRIYLITSSLAYRNDILLCYSGVKKISIWYKNISKVRPTDYVFILFLFKGTNKKIFVYTTLKIKKYLNIDQVNVKLAHKGFCSYEYT